MNIVITSSNESKSLIVSLRAENWRQEHVYWLHPHKHKLNFEITFPTTQMEIVSV